MYEPAFKFAGTFNVKVTPGNAFPPVAVNVAEGEKPAEVTPAGNPDTLYVPFTVPLLPLKEVTE